MDDEQTEIPDIEQAVQGQIDDDGDIAEAKYQQDQDQMFGEYPERISKDSIFTFFKSLLGLKDSSKVANLDKRELGMLDLSVRGNQSLAKISYLMNDKNAGDYFMSRGEIILSTSMSKKGWLPELVVSQKRFSSRMVQPVKAPSKPGVLGFGKKNEQQQI